MGITDAQIINALERKFISLAGDLDEHGRRRWAACEAIALGNGRISALSFGKGLSDHTIRKGIREVESNHTLPSIHQLITGGGRKPLERHQPSLVESIERLVEPTKRGDPRSLLR